MVPEITPFPLRLVRNMGVFPRQHRRLHPFVKTADFAAEIPLETRRILRYTASARADRQPLLHLRNSASLTSHAPGGEQELR
jgi:hypothetical protein